MDWIYGKKTTKFHWDIQKDIWKCRGTCHMCIPGWED